MAREAHYHSCILCRRPLATLFFFSRFFISGSRPSLPNRSALHASCRGTNEHYFSASCMRSQAVNPSVRLYFSSSCRKHKNSAVARRGSILLHICGLCSQLITRYDKRTGLIPGQTILPTQANSSQVTKSKFVSAGGQTIPSSRVNLQGTIQFSEYDRVVT